MYLYLLSQWEISARSKETFYLLENIINIIINYIIQL